MSLRLLNVDSTAALPTKRRLELDVLRVLASFFVVVIHVISGKWLGLPANTLSWQAINALQNLVHTAIPIFVMISGANFLQKECSLKILFRKYVLRLFLIYIVWGALYAIDTVSLPELFTLPGIKGFAVQCLKGKYHLWFLPYMICAYLTLPLLWALVRHKNGAYLPYVCLVFFCVPTLTTLDVIFPGLTVAFEAVYLLNPKLGHFPAMMLLGYLLYTTPKRPRESPLLLALLALAVAVISIAAGALITCYRGEKCQLFGDSGLPTILLAALILRFVRLLAERRPIARGQKLILRLSSCTLGVFLLHVFILEHLDCWFGLSVDSLPLLLSVPLLCILVYVLSLLTTSLLKRIPVVGKWLI